MGSLFKVMMISQFKLSDRRNDECVRWEVITQTIEVDDSTSEKMAEQLVQKIISIAPSTQEEGYSYNGGNWKQRTLESREGIYAIKQMGVQKFIVPVCAEPSQAQEIIELALKRLEVKLLTQAFGGM